MDPKNGKIADRPTTRLPNGMEICEINSYETGFLYKEIFEDGFYLRHGVGLPSDAVVFDVGANIGLFSLYCLEKAPSAKIYAFEPAPHCAACFRQNLAKAGNSVELIEAALVDETARQSFTYYPHYSIMSGLKAEPAEDMNTLRKGAANQLGLDSYHGGARKMVDLLVGSKLNDPITFQCDGFTISDMIARYRLDRIDVLKIDVEKAEGLVLHGVAQSDWPKIRQVVVEAHDLGHAEHRQLERMLQEQGFRTTLTASDELSASDIYSIYATRTQSTEA